MKRLLLVTLSLAAVVWITGCGATSSGVVGGPLPDALNGRYAIVLSGFDSLAGPVAIAGTITADGLGHVTGGEIDVNDNGTLSSSSAVAGTYAFGFNGLGPLGTITLTNGVGSVGHPLAFAFSLQTSGSIGQIMDLDTNNFIAAGTMQLQDSTAFSLSKLAGDYIAKFNGPNASIATAAIGRLTLNSSGITSNVIFDRSGAGVGTFGPSSGASASVSFAGTGPDANGRGTFTLALNDGLASTQNFAYYAVNANQIIAIQTDTTGEVTAELSRQNMPLSDATVATTGSVFGMSGLDTANNEITAVGRLQITTAPDTGILHWDSNDSGAIVGPINLPNQPVVFDPATGRGSISILGGASNGLADSAVFYLSGPGTGYILDSTPGVTNRAMAGNLAPQATGTFSVASDLGGLSWTVRGKGSAVSDASALVGAFSLISPSTKYSLTFDSRVATGNIQTQTDVNVTGITVLTLDSVTGRGTLAIPTLASSATEVFYIIGPNQFVYMDISPISSGLNAASPLYFVSPR